MLRYIEISNFALIDHASIDFGSGLCVLTGETGAGKSIIIDSINVALGARAARDIVRKGSSGATVTAIFSTDEGYINERLSGVLDENGITSEDLDELILSREISVSGRSICRVNGRLVATPLLKTIGEMMVDLHGQHENHSLMKRDMHIEMIDNFGGAALLAKRDEYSAMYSEYRRIKTQMADLMKNESERARMIDILTFQINEIKSVKPQPDEDALLFAQIEELANAEKINNSLAAACELLSGGEYNDDAQNAHGAKSALGSIAEASRSMSLISQYSAEYAELSARISEAQYMIEDISSTLRAKRDAGDLDPRRLDALSARLEAIERLKRKYGATIKEVHAFYRQSTKRLHELTGSEQTAVELEGALAGIESGLMQSAAELTEMRKKAAAYIEEGVVNELADLEMLNCRFEVLFNSYDNISEYNSKGRDQLEFLFCANPGEELKPLARIASGGEMSRVMLAIKSVLVGTDNIPTMIFDEIDAGISGKAASRVAEKLHLLSRERQIVCVTHLAQIACMADDQFLIEKTSTTDETQTQVEKLEYSRRAGEISRMLGGGAPTEASLRLSHELLERAEQFKLGSRE